MTPSFRAVVRKVLPLSNQKVLSLTHCLRDLRTLSLALSSRKRKAVRADFARCRSFEDYFEFARTWMNGGALQHREEIRAAIDYLRKEIPRCICEIGTANGGTNLLLTHAIESVETIIGVDLYVMNRRYLHLIGRPGQQLHFINGPSASPHTFDRVRRALAGRKIDMLLIDGDHRYEGVRQDFLRYSKLMRDGGIIMFHDIVPDHQSRYGRPSNRCAGDVPRFWKQLKPYYRHREFVLDPEQDGFGLGVLHWSESVPLPEL